MMRIKCGLLVVALFLAMFSGCNQKKDKVEEQELLPISREEFTYEISDELRCFAIDENGLLYTSEYAAYEKDEDKQFFATAEEAENFINAASGCQNIKVYDLEGNCVQEEKVEIGRANIECMSIQGNQMYCVVSNARMVLTVYSISLETWEATKLAELGEYSLINRLLPLGDYLYVLGRSKEATEYGYVLHPSVHAFDYAGERICRIQLGSDESKVERMKVDYPIDMYVTDKETLMIYQYTEEKGFGFLELNPTEGTITEQEWSHGEFNMTDMSSCGSGYICSDGMRLSYGTPKGDLTQLLPEHVRVGDSVKYLKGFMFYLNENDFGKIKRVCIADIVKDNKKIRFLMHEYTSDKPFGVGYCMEELVYTAEEFALKVLAGDSDYDMYLLDSREDCAYNLKKNGAFYALNEVEGVQDYLDACFPYLKDAATNENGEIWMFPVALAVPGLLYNREYCAEYGVDYSEMSLQEFINFTVESEKTDPELTTISYVCLAEEFFMQYLEKYDSFDTQELRTYLALLKDAWNEGASSWGIYEAFDKGLAYRKEVADFYYHQARYLGTMLDYAGRIPDLSRVGVVETPKMSEGIGNVGTVTFIVVNPKSDNLEATLEYISDLAEFFMSSKDTFLLADINTYTDNPFIRDMYHLYANGSADFRIASEVYLEDFSAYIENEKGLEEAIAEAERKRKIYMEE